MKKILVNKLFYFFSLWCELSKSQRNCLVTIRKVICLIERAACRDTSGHLCHRTWWTVNQIQLLSVRNKAGFQQIDSCRLRLWPAPVASCAMLIQLCLHHLTCCCLITETQRRQSEDLLAATPPISSLLVRKQCAVTVSLLWVCVVILSWWYCQIRTSFPQIKQHSSTTVS